MISLKQQTRTPSKQTPSPAAKSSSAKVAVVIGGGVAGWAAARVLSHLGWRVELHEKSSATASKGHALLLMKNGLSALESMGVKGDLLKHGSQIKFAKTRVSGSNNSEILTDCVCLPRNALVEALDCSSEIKLFHDSQVVGIEEDDLGSFIRFDDGGVRRADLIVGADGVRSVVRQFVAPDFKIRMGRVQEFVALLPKIENRFFPSQIVRKIHLPKQGLAAGIAPAGPGREVVWIQFDHQRWCEGQQSDRELLESILIQLPRAIAIRIRNAQAVHRWRTCDAVKLEKMSRGNVLLVGDAAHPCLPFTSQGANAALVDAVNLGRGLRQHVLMDDALDQFCSKSEATANQHLQAGRMLEQEFLSGRMTALPRSASLAAA
ncbi:MAG: NAD(P)/FAD-dependent oxidoreductase [Mariniblastus sp.]|nr:NAD(P)/FAD-dependent oxidoreductase [Mariniblastus sp.]MDG2181360.1 NAD(P)/FAD-dependent oxidoreductase [Mariniblastus sp.]